MERALDHEKLDVYQIELQFIAWLADFFLEVSQSRVARCRELFEQLDRASLSALLNTAEEASDCASVNRDFRRHPTLYDAS
jgi:hypothetical protein